MASGDETLQLVTSLGSANNLGSLTAVLTVTSGHTYTILSFSICNTSASNDESFSCIVDNGGGGADAYIYLTQSLPAASTFVHSDKIIMNADDHLSFVTASTSDCDILISYLDQEL
jgi:hypothetical protein